MIDIRLASLTGLEQRADELGPRYEAILVVNGQDVARIKSDEDEGWRVVEYLNSYTSAALLAIKDMVKADFPPLDMSHYGFPDVPRTLEEVCDELAEASL